MLEEMWVAIWSCFQPSLSFTVWCAGPLLCEGRIPNPVQLVCSLLTCPLCRSIVYKPVFSLVPEQ